MLAGGKGRARRANGRLAHRAAHLDDRDAQLRLREDCVEQVVRGRREGLALTSQDGWQRVDR